MPKVKMITSMAGPQGSYGAGSELEVSGEFAAALIKGGYARLLDEKKPLPEIKPAPEREATVSPTRAAVTRGGKKKHK